MDEFLPPWKRQLLALRGKLGKPAVGATPSSCPRAQQPIGSQQRPMAINIGLDFGTSYTKVCYRLVGQETSGVVGFPNGSGKGGFFVPSVLYYDPKTRSVANARSRSSDTEQQAVRYLKMLIAGQTPGAVPSALADLLSTTPGLWRCLSAYYLSGVIRAAKTAVMSIEHLAIGDRPVEWSVNMGVPVDFLESEVLPAFREVLIGAFVTQLPTERPVTLESLCCSYRAAIEDGQSRDLDCHVEPELVMELYSFAAQHQAPEGIYGIYDIGGGTLDGSVFTLDRREGRPFINILTSRVEPLGLDVMASKVWESLGHSDAMAALQHDPPRMELPPGTLRPLEHSVHCFVSRTVIGARSKDVAGWFEGRTVFPVFVCGGGRASEWLVASLLRTYAAHQHKNCGIPRYSREEIVVPPDLKLNGLPSADCHRHLVAYGLSFLHGQGPEVVGFPRDNPERDRKTAGEVDGFLELQRERYGKVVS